MLFIDVNCEHGNLERYLDDKMDKVHNVHRDIRNDCGDDGSYIVAICEKDNQFYLHIICASYYTDINDLVLTEKDFEEKGGVRDFVPCESLEDAQKKLTTYIEYLDKILDEVEETYLYDYEEEDFKEFLGVSLKEEERYFLSHMAFPYYEYRDRERDKLVNLIKQNYTPNFEN